MGELLIRVIVYRYEDDTDCTKEVIVPDDLNFENSSTGLTEVNRIIKTIHEAYKAVQEAPVLKSREEITHRHGAHDWHSHPYSEYKDHQQSINDEEIVNSETRPIFSSDENGEPIF